MKLGFSSDELQVALARAALARGQADKLLERFGSTVLSAPKANAELRALVGTAYLERARPREAGRAFEEALELDASNVTAQVGAARLAAARADLAEALSRVERALGASPGSVPALLLKAELLARQSQHDAAESAYRAAIDAAPSQLAPRLSLIVHLLNAGSPEKAAAEVAAMEATAPRDPRVLYAKALVLVRQQKFPAARQAVLQVLKAAPEHVPSLTLAGIAALNTGALGEAESHLRQAVFNEPHALGAKRLLATTHLRMGKTDVALSEVQDLLKVSQDPSTLALAGEAYLASGDAAAAARHYELAKALAPKDTSVRTRLGLVRFAAGEPERAVSELEAASAADAKDYQADLALIANYLRRREADRALAAVQALEGKQPENPMTYNLRGAALILKKDLAGARASFERALALRPAYMPAVNNLARLDLRENDRVAARKRYQDFLDRDPNNEPALIGLAAVLRTTGADARRNREVAEAGRGRQSRIGLGAQRAHQFLHEKPQLQCRAGRRASRAGRAARRAAHGAGGRHDPTGRRPDPPGARQPHSPRGNAARRAGTTGSAGQGPHGGEAAGRCHQGAARGARAAARFRRGAARNRRHLCRHRAPRGCLARSKSGPGPQAEGRTGPCPRRRALPGAGEPRPRRADLPRDAEEIRPRRPRGAHSCDPRSGGQVRTRPTRWPRSGSGAIRKMP